MKRDLDVRYTIDEISDKILDELYENAHKYKHYHTGSVRQLIEDSIKYLKETKYTLDIVDVVVGDVCQCTQSPFVHISKGE